MGWAASSYGSPTDQRAGSFFYNYHKTAQVNLSGTSGLDIPIFSGTTANANVNYPGHLSSLPPDINLQLYGWVGTNNNDDVSPGAYGRGFVGLLVFSGTTGTLSATPLQAGAFGTNGIQFRIPIVVDSNKYPVVFVRTIANLNVAGSAASNGSNGNNWFSFMYNITDRPPS